MDDVTPVEEKVSESATGSREPALLKMWLELQEDIEQLDSNTESGGNAKNLKSRFTALTKQLLALQKEEKKEEDAPPHWASGAQNIDGAHLKQFLMKGDK